MPLPEPIIHDALIFQQFNDPRSPIARELELIADTIVAPQAQEALSRPADRDIRNPAPGPPEMRSGDLHASIHTLPAQFDGITLVAYVVASAQHRGFLYPQHLREQGYRFLPDEPYYLYTDQPDI